MPRAKTPAVRERALELIRGGMSVRGAEERLAAEGHKVSKSTVASLAREARKSPRPSPTTSAPSASTRAQETASPAEQHGSTAPPAEKAAEPQLDAALLASFEGDVDVRQLERVAARLSARMEKAIQDGDLTVLKSLMPLRLQLAQTIARVRPPPEADPEADPANIAAREQLRARIGLLVAEAESADATREAIREHLARLDAIAARERAA